MNLGPRLGDLIVEGLFAGVCGKRTLSPRGKGTFAILRETDELLVRRAQLGDRDALESLVCQWEGRLLYYIRRLVEDEAIAWDVLQETWIKVIRGIRSLRDPRSLPLWLYRIARATAMTHWRALYRQREESLSDEHASETAGDWAFEAEEAEAIHWALSRLSFDQREALTLHFLEDFSVEEVAGIVGVPPGTVKSRIHYGKKALRRILDQEAKRYG